MTDKVNPSKNRPAESFVTAGAIAYGGHGGDGFVVDGANPTEIVAQDTDINEANMNAFDETSSADSLDVDIDAGEAFVFGSWLAIDTSTTVTLDASTAGQTVYVGWNKAAADDVIIGLSSAFGTDDQRISIWTFDTDGSGVTAVTDERRIGYTQDVDGKTYYGDADFSISYNSSTDELEIVDEVNDTVKQTFDKSGDVFFPNGEVHAESGLNVAGSTMNNLSTLNSNSGAISILDTPDFGVTYLNEVNNGRAIRFYTNESDHPSDEDPYLLTTGGQTGDMPFGTDFGSLIIGGRTTDNSDKVAIVTGNSESREVKFFADSSGSTFQNGNVNLDGNNITNVRSSGDSPVVSGTDYEIQKDGTDGTGVINFKTS